MKRICGLFLALALVLGLCACGKSIEDQWREQYDLGVRYLSEGNYQEAIIAFTAAIAIDEKQPQAYLGRGDAYMALEDTPENLSAAQEDYRAALALNDTLREAWQNLAEAYVAQQDYAAAVEVLRQAQEALGDDSVFSGRIAELEALANPQDAQDEDTAQDPGALAPGSEEYFEAVAAHLTLDNVDFDFAVNGIPFVTADIYELAASVGLTVDDHLPQIGASARNFLIRFFQAPGSDTVTVLDLLEEADAATVVEYWPSEYFADIAPTDTLDQALEKLGFTPEERAYLTTCNDILLDTREDGTLTLQASPYGEGSSVDKNECSLTVERYNKIAYAFVFAVPWNGAGDPPFVDGQAVLDSLSVWNRNYHPENN